MKPYSAYKNSGVEWLGEIPEGWEVKKLKLICNLFSGETPIKDSDGIFPIYGANGVIGYTNRFNIKRDSIIIGRVGASGSINIAPAKSWISDNALIVDLKAASYNFIYIFYLLQGLNFDELINKNAQPLITATQIKNIYTAVPDLDEQTTIASFLDQKTSRIDELIKKNERLIELLKEKRQAVISHAVTKGLNPNANMKDSGIEWLGEIPEGWEVKRLKYVCIQYAEYGLNIEAENYQSNGIRFIRTTDIDDYGNLKEEGFYLNESLVKQYILKSGDLLISRSGTIGRTFLFDSNNNEKATFAGYLVRFALDKKETFPKYIFYFTQSHAFFEWIRTQLIETTIGNVNAQKYANLCVTIPTVDHQTTIASFLDQKTSKVDEAIKNIQSQIATLKEYRQALISNVVTGKVRV